MTCAVDKCAVCKAVEHEAGCPGNCCAAQRSTFEVGAQPPGEGLEPPSVPGGVARAAASHLPPPHRVSPQPAAHRSSTAYLPICPPPPTHARTHARTHAHTPRAHAHARAHAHRRHHRTPPQNDVTLQVPYDILLLGVGSVNNTFGIPGVREHCFFLKSIDDARALRVHIA